MVSHNNPSEAASPPPGALPMLAIGLILITMGVLAFNQMQIGRAEATLAGLSAIPLASTSVSAPAASATVQTATRQTVAASTQPPADLKALEAQVFPRGVPDVYGKELGVSYDDPVSAMKVLGPMDDGNGMSNPTLNARYVKMGTMIACEFCCGANTLVFKDGKAACGCAHSYAMRGLAKYLLTKHPDMSDDKILEEMAKWKILFFPQQHMQKAVQFQAAGKPINPTDLSGNKFRGFTAQAASSGASSGGVGGYATQVGGC